MQEYMKLKNPAQIRVSFTEKRGWRTVTEIANNLGISYHKVSKAFGGGSIKAATAQVIADALNEEMIAIVEFVLY